MIMRTVLLAFLLLFSVGFVYANTYTVPINSVYAGTDINSIGREAVIASEIGAFPPTGRHTIVWANGTSEEFDVTHSYPTELEIVDGTQRDAYGNLIGGGGSGSGGGAGGGGGAGTGGGSLGPGSWGGGGGGGGWHCWGSGTGVVCRPIQHN